MNSQQRDVQRKIKVLLRHAEQTGCVARACRHFGIGFYRWRIAYQQRGEAWLINAKPIPKNSVNRTPPETADKVLHLRSTYHLGPIRIVWYLARYNIQISEAGVSRILKRNGVSRLPRGTRLRKIHTKRYNKQVPSHHIQIDVKLLTFEGPRAAKIRRFQYTAIDDATRIRALKVYESIPRQTQSISSITSLANFRFGSGKFAPTMDMASRPNFTGMSNTKAFVTPTSSAESRS